MKRGEAKRQAILDTAFRLFREQGFEKTSMSEITAQVGGSKATLYSHFSSKESLFAECMTAAIAQYGAGAFAGLDAEPQDMVPALHQFGQNFLRFIGSNEMVAVRRLMIAEASRLGVGKLFYEQIRNLRDRVALFLGKCMANGHLRCEDPVHAANHLRGLLESEYMEPLLLQVCEDPLSEEEIRRASACAVDAFLRGYAQ